MRVSLLVTVMRVSCDGLCQECAAASLLRLLPLQGTNQSISFLSTYKAVEGVALGLPQILNGGRFFDKEGRRVEQPGVRYRENGVRLPY